MATIRKALLLVGLTLTLLACATLTRLTAAPTGTPLPTPTWTAQPTLTPTPRPTRTPEPTETPTTAPTDTLQATELADTSPTDTLEPEPSLTPTVPAPTLPPPPPAPGELACQLIWQSPANAASYSPDEFFTVGWNIRNIGSASWDPNSVVFTYLGGLKPHDYPVVQLTTSVAPGQTIVLSVRMRAPKNSTKYTTFWSLRRGNAFFCRVMLSILVE